MGRENSHKSRPRYSNPNRDKHGRFTGEYGRKGWVSRTIRITAPPHIIQWFEEAIMEKDEKTPPAVARGKMLLRLFDQ